MHHPFTSPLKEDFELLEPTPVRACQCIRHGDQWGGDRGWFHPYPSTAPTGADVPVARFTADEAKAQFGFLMDAFRYGAPPHGGVAFGFDRWCSLFGGSESIRDYIAFPKNNSGRDVMIDSPSPVDVKQLEELHLRLRAEG
jgi:aspartyl-tRNA synthetase